MVVIWCFVLLKSLCKAFVALFVSFLMDKPLLPIYTMFGKTKCQLTVNLSPKTRVYDEVLYCGINEVSGHSVWR